MIFISQQELEKNGVFSENNTKVIFNNKVLIMGPSFAEIFREKAINYVREFSQKGQDFLVVKNNGYFTIWVESEQAKVQNLAEVIPISTAKKKEESPAIACPLIACIDDSKTVQRQVKLALESVGYKVLNITDPSSSLTLLVRQKPALILLDINMPEIDGYELCQMFHRSRKLRDIPIVMVTGREGMIDRIRAKLVGATHYLTKPFDPHQLIEVVQRFAPLPSPTQEVPQSPPNVQFIHP